MSCQIPQHSNDLLLILSNWPNVIAEMGLSDILYNIHAVQISLDDVITEGENLTYTRGNWDMQTIFDLLSNWYGKEWIFQTTGYTPCT